MDIFDEIMFWKLIWLIWVQYYKDINELFVLDFVDNIIKNNFIYFQLEIDDDWILKYGDMDFNNVKFFDLKFMVKKLNDKGFRVIVWLYLFFNIDLNVFIEVVLKFYLIKEFDFL